MIKTEIYIEQQRLDVSDDISTLISYSVDDIKDFASRNTSFSKTIVIPGTARNNALLGSIFDVTVSNQYDPDSDNISTNFNAAKGADCIIFKDHIQVFKGTFRLLEMIINKGEIEYECAVFGELSGLVSAIGSLKLHDLDFSAYNHTWNATNIQASWDNVSGETGYYYPLIDYGTVSQAKADWDIRAFRPAFKVREYIDKIITGAGYSWESDLFNTTRFKSLIVPNNQKTFQRSTYTLLNAARNTIAEIINSGTSSLENINMTSYPFYFFTGGPSLFTYSGTDPIITTIDLNFYGSYVANTTGYELRLYKNGVIVAAFTKVIAQTGDTLTHLYDWTKSVTVGLINGDTLQLRAAETGAASGTDNLRLISGTFKVNSNTSVSVDLSPGNTVEVNETLPRGVLQKDFLSSIIKLFNLYVYEDRYTTKKLYIKPYVDYFDLNPSGVNDWNYKFDRTKETRLKPMGELNSRFYDFEFKKDSDYFNTRYFEKYGEVYGNYKYDSQFEFINESQKIELIFASTVLVGYSGADKVVPAIYKLNAGVEERTDSLIRIMQSKKITGVANWSIKDGASVLATTSNYGYGGHYDDPDAPANDIHFGVPRELFFTVAAGSPNVTQFNVYWSSYMAEITDKDSKLMTAYFKLTEKDIHELDFSKLIYIDGAYWRLNKIIDWNASDPDICKAELLKAINLVY